MYQLLSCIKYLQRVSNILIFGDVNACQWYVYYIYMQSCVWYKTS